MLLSKPDAICMARSPFYVDRQSYPSKPLRPNYEADQSVDCYRTLTCFRKDINVKRNDYVKGYCLYTLEIDPYYSFNIKRQGHCRLEMKFAKERHRALGRDATFSWSRALTHPPRCNRTRHRDCHLVSDFVEPPSWIGSGGGRHLGPEVVGTAILDRKWRQKR